MFSRSPRSYAFANKVRLRLPFAFGAKALIVTDLASCSTAQTRSRSGWITTEVSSALISRTASPSPRRFLCRDAAPKDVIAEFGDDRGDRRRRAAATEFVCKARVHPSEVWTDIVTFAFLAPPSSDAMSRYIHLRQRHHATGRDGTPSLSAADAAQGPARSRSRQ
jgi:hypothetical protein